MKVSSGNWKLDDSYPGPVLLIVRHGQTDFNLKRTFQGQLDVPLNDLGRIQAEDSATAVLSVLKILPLSLVKSCHLLSSDLSRASDTARVIHKRIKEKYLIHNDLKLTTLLREQNVGDLQGMTLDEFCARAPSEAAFYQKSVLEDPYRSRAPGKDAESKMDVAKRVRQVMQETIIPAVGEKRSELHIWCAHGWVINALMELMSLSLGADPYIGNADVLITTGNTSHQNPSSLATQFDVQHTWKILEHVEVGERLGHLSFARPAA